MRVTITEWVGKRRMEGVTEKKISDELGISWGTLAKWAKDLGSKKTGQWKPIKIIADRKTVNRNLVVHGVGFSVEGVDIDGLAELLRALQ